MVSNYLDALPLELQQEVYQHYFKRNVIDEINNITSAYKWRKPSKRLCNLCDDHGSLQVGSKVDNTLQVLFDTSSEYYEDPHNCTCSNCYHSGWPCLNHAFYPSQTIGVANMWDVGDHRKEPFSQELIDHLKNDPDMKRFVPLPL